MAIKLFPQRYNFELDLSTFNLPNWFNDRPNIDPIMQPTDIHYQIHADDILSTMLHGFFEGWPNPPDAGTHLRILRGSSHIVLALTPARNQVIGFITAISDGVSAAYIPHLEVLPKHRGKGIGSQLVKRMLKELNGIYMIDLMCDDDVVPFYEKFGMQRAGGMLIRNYQNQSGLPIGTNEPHW